MWINPCMYIYRQITDAAVMGQPLPDTHSPKHTLGIYLHLYFHYNREEDEHEWGKDEGSPLHSLLTMHILYTCKYKLYIIHIYLYTHTLQ